MFITKNDIGRVAINGYGRKVKIEGYDHHATYPVSCLDGCVVRSYMMSGQYDHAGPSREDLICWVDTTAEEKIKAAVKLLQDVLDNGSTMVDIKTILETLGYDIKTVVTHQVVEKS